LELYHINLFKVKILLVLMEERIIEERKRVRVYTSSADYLRDHPQSDEFDRGFVDLSIQLEGHYDEHIFLKEGEYTWGDRTEIKIWNSPEEFARQHSKKHPMPQVQEHFDSKLAMNIFPRFKRKCLINVFGFSMIPVSKEGYMFEIVGLRDKDGNGVDSARARERYPQHVYCTPDENLKLFQEQSAETTRFFKAFEARQERTKHLSLQCDHRVG
jgi:hypothetical protein